MYSCKEGICCPLSVVTAQNLHRIWGRVMRKQEILWGMLPKVYPSSGRKEKPRLAAADVIAVLIAVVWVRVPAYTWAAFSSLMMVRPWACPASKEMKSSPSSSLSSKSG